MNYRHAYHAGNFADVVKHIVLARIIDYLKRKDSAFRVIDTHAGVGLYRLDSGGAARTGEWQGGIGRLLEGSLASAAAELAAPYLDALRAVNAGRKPPTAYPGSPSITRHLLRKQDRLTAIELHPEDVARLRENFADDIQTRVIELDGWLALGAHVPPKEKRGLVLVDPPFEEAGEFERLVDGLRKAHKRWPGGIYALWYPIKDRRAVNAFRATLTELSIPKILDIRFEIRPPSAEPKLDGAGMVIVNPPHPLAGEMAAILPELSKRMSEDGKPRFAVEWIAGEAVSRD